MATIFVSYSPKNRDYALKLDEKLRAVGYDKSIFLLLLDGDVWDTFAHTPYENVRDGNLPPAQFYEKLAQHAPKWLSTAQHLLILVVICQAVDRCIGVKSLLSEQARHYNGDDAL